MNRTRAGEIPITVQGKRFTTHIMAQPKIAENILSDEVMRDHGLLARFLTVYPPGNIGNRLKCTKLDESAQVLVDFYAKIKDCLNQKPDYRHNLFNAPELPILGLSSTTYDILYSFYGEMELAQAKDGRYESIRPFASKACEQVCRLAGCLTLFSNYTAPEIDKGVLIDTINLVKWYIEEVLRIQSEGQIPERLRQAEGLRQWLLMKHREEELLLLYTSVRHITQYSPRGLRLRQKASADRAVDILMSHGWLLPAQEPRNIKGVTHITAFRIVVP